MIRFKDGLPTAVWYSQHEYGEAYSYKAVQKADKRVIGYSAKGSHANYAKAAAHDLHNYSNILFPLPFSVSVILTFTQTKKFQLT